MEHYGMLDVSLYQIQIFLAVAEERNFSHAADTMNIAQPALSKRIKSLEESVGVELFDRGKRPVELTPAGEALYKQLQPLARRIETALSSVRDESRRNLSRLSVGLLDSGKQLSFFHKAGELLETETPGLTFSWEYIAFDKWKGMLNTGCLDIMMMLRMAESEFESDWSWVRIMEVPKLVCMLKTNPLSEKERITYEDLRSQRFVMNPPKIMPMYYRFVREQTMLHGGYEPTVARFSPNPHSLIANIKYDDEVAFCDMYHRDADSDFIRCFELPATKSGLDAIWRKDNRNPHIERYLELTREQLRQTYPGALHF
ncbi:MAG: LysR family transcriptional regulator [Clostridiales Family XIII bacterium]|nr:LysR family transcriptional regulator [Clostridiales Family XIII bacterium]